MSELRKKPGVAFWATVVVVVVLAYPLSFGPVCWWRSESYHEASARFRNRYLPPKNHLLRPPDSPCAPEIYWPIGWLAVHGPQPLPRLICWYATAGGKRHVVIPIDAEAKCKLWPI